MEIESITDAHDRVYYFDAPSLIVSKEPPEFQNAEHLPPWLDTRGGAFNFHIWNKDLNVWEVVTIEQAVEHGSGHEPTYISELQNQNNGKHSIKVESTLNAKGLELLLRYVEAVDKAQPAS